MYNFRFKDMYAWAGPIISQMFLKIVIYLLLIKSMFISFRH